VTDYSKKTDFEIDAAVAAIKFPGHKITNFAGEAVVWFSNLETRVFRYCNSWADAGPIAQEKHIGINYCSAGKEWIAGDFYPDASTADFGADKYFAYDTNPCRAICIVFLMMNEGE